MTTNFMAWLDAREWVPFDGEMQVLISGADGYVAGTIEVYSDGTIAAKDKDGVDVDVDLWTVIVTPGLGGGVDVMEYATPFEEALERAQEESEGDEDL